jgi:hypothetical protein
MNHNKNKVVCECCGGVPTFLRESGVVVGYHCAECDITVLRPRFQGRMPLCPTCKKRAIQVISDDDGNPIKFIHRKSKSPTAVSGFLWWGCEVGADMGGTFQTYSIAGRLH